MIRANVPSMYRYRCFLLAIEAAMILDGLVVVEIDMIDPPASSRT
jgi:4-hydroxybenzoate polyprenyltransferase